MEFYSIRSFREWLGGFFAQPSLCIAHGPTAFGATGEGIHAGFRIEYLFEGARDHGDALDPPCFDTDEATRQGLGGFSIRRTEYLKKPDGEDVTSVKWLGASKVFKMADPKPKELVNGKRKIFGPINTRSRSSSDQITALHVRRERRSPDAA